MRYVAAALLALLLTAGVMLKLSWSANDTLKSEKLRIEGELGATKADLKLSADNANRMLSDKNRLIASERDRAETERHEAVEAAKIQKDIEYATDGKACVGSDPVQRLMRGLWNRPGTRAASDADDSVPAAGRAGNAN